MSKVICPHGPVDQPLAVGSRLRVPEDIYVAITREHLRNGTSIGAANVLLFKPNLDQRVRIGSIVPDADVPKVGVLIADTCGPAVKRAELRTVDKNIPLRGTCLALAGSIRNTVFVRVRR